MDELQKTIVAQAVEIAKLRERLKLETDRADMWYRLYEGNKNGDDLRERREGV